MRVKHEAKPNPLPPIWVKLFSCIFLVFIPLPLINWFLDGLAVTHQVNGFGLRLQSGIVSELWIHAFEMIFFLAGLTGLFILTKRSFAYGFGIIYCLTALAVAVPAYFFAGVSGDDAVRSAIPQYALLLCFLVHLIRHRRQWVQQYGRRSLDDAASQISA
jgi:hypothetical protein